MRISGINSKHTVIPANTAFGSKGIQGFLGARFHGHDKIIVCLIGFLSLFVLSSGCSPKKESVDNAEDYLQKSRVYYQQAVDEYKKRIAEGKNPDELYFKLGEIYYTAGKFEDAIGAFKNTSAPGSGKLLGMSYFGLGKYTEALEAFDKIELTSPDDECFYYHGLTSERLNLFDQALELYRKVKGDKFKAAAQERINRIEKQISVANIKDVSPESYEIIKACPSDENYPQAGALILSCDEQIEVTEEKTQVSTLHYLVKIINERGKEEFSETHIDYDSTYEKVELEYARTIKPDGTVVDVGTRHIRDVSKYLNFPLYSNARVYIISFPEIVEGAVVEYKLKIQRSQLVNKKDFVLNYPIQSSEPVLNAYYSVSIPKGTNISLKTINEHYNYFGAQTRPEIMNDSERLTYIWKFKDIPQVIPEPNMPPGVEINPAILLSSFGSWDQIYEWWWELAKDKIKADASIQSQVAELIKTAATDEEKAKAIYNFCAQKIRYVAVEYGQAGYEPHEAKDIFKNKYGDCKDQAILLITMLREAGLKAYPVLISTSDYYNMNKDFPSVSFNHCIAVLSLDDKLIFLDPTAETCSYGDLPGQDQQRFVLVFKDDSYSIEETPLYPAQHNMLKQRVEIKMNPDDTITADRSVFSSGVYDQGQRYWLLYTAPELVEQKLREKIQELSIGARLNSYTVKNLNNLNIPVILRYQFGGPEFSTVADNLRIIPQLSGLDLWLTAQDQRQYPLDLELLDTKEIEFEIEIPVDFLVKYIPEDVVMDSLWLKFNADYRIESSKIYFTQRVERKVKTISETAYPEFKKFYEELAKKIKQRIILERQVPKTAEK